jgi:hypothetical protein
LWKKVPVASEKIRPECGLSLQEHESVNRKKPGQSAVSVLRSLPAGHGSGAAGKAALSDSEGAFAVVGPQGALI